MADADVAVGWVARDVKAVVEEVKEQEVTMAAQVNSVVKVERVFDLRVGSSNATRPTHTSH